MLSFTFISCNSVDLKDKDSVTNWIDGKYMVMDCDCGDDIGRLTFNKNGTFYLKSPSPNDPTQYYEGKWYLGEFRTYNDGSGAMRDITISFNNYGWITDNHRFNGTRFDGYGREITGFISKKLDNYEFTSEVSDYNTSQIYKDGHFQKGSKYWHKDIK